MMLTALFARCRGASLAVILGVTGAALVEPALAADWPAYRHDSQRSSVTEEKLSFPLQAAWSWTSARPLSPAWPSTPRVLNQMTFDHAFQPVVADGIVCFGSTADDTLRALDAKTGAERWHFVAGGPIRFAPEIAGGKIYFAADDGLVHCLELATGKPVWSFCAAPSDERLLGDGRMISRWPCRNGVLVDAGVVYAVAGMWPTEGVFIYALDAGTGKVIWCHDTGGTPAPWENFKNMAFFYSGLSPQGPLMASRDSLVVPAGRTVASTLDRGTGKLLNLQPGQKYSGGGYALCVTGDFFVTYLVGKKSQPWIVGGFSTRRGGGGGIKFAGVPQPAKILVPDPGEDGDQEILCGISMIMAKGRFYARRAFQLALAGETLVAGERDAIAAYDAKLTLRDAKNKNAPARYDPETQAEIWRAPVAGLVYGLAVADGRLYVSTDRGEITCFEPGAGEGGNKVGVRVQGSGKKGEEQGKPASGNLRSDLADLLRQGAMDVGYALVADDPDGTAAIGLARATELRIITVVSKAAEAAALREKLLATTDLHGTRIQVFEALQDGRLPFAQYFANAVVVGNSPGAVGREGSGIKPTELYRVLRPSGGMLVCPGLAPAVAESVFKASGALAEEIRAGGTIPCLVRGRLPGAMDWDSPTLSDKHLKAPLRPLWFGGPGPMEQYDRLTGYPTITAAGGRYFYLIRGNLVGVDVYNGRKLWERPAPLERHRVTIDDREVLVTQDTTMGVSQEKVMEWRSRPSAIIGLTADPTNVFLTLGRECFRGQGPTCIKLDARTGGQRAIYGAVAPSSQVFSLSTPQTWEIRVDEEHSGTLTMAAEAGGLRLDLSTRDPSLTPVDGWDLFFDFRPAAERFGLYDEGTFWINVLPAGASNAPASWRCVRGEASPAFKVSGVPQAGGTRTIVSLPWTNLGAVTKVLPKTFGFAAALLSKDEDVDEPEVKKDKAGREAARERKRVALRAKPRVTYLFADEMVDSINNGWATLVLPDGSAKAAAARVPSVLRGKLDQVPAKFRKSNIRLAYYLPDQGAQRKPRVHPLTGDVATKKFVRGNGCGAIFSAAFLYYMRSSTVGIYDLLEDAGIWSFGGVRPSCGQNMLAAQGVLIVADDNSACTCQYAFQTPFVLAHAERRLQEDWQQFYDFTPDNIIRTAALNLGAPGDRRDAAGTLWLGFPRFEGGNGEFVTPGGSGRGELNGLWPRNFNFSLVVPLKIGSVTNLGPYRFNADRTPVRSTGNPWLYASGYRGIEKLSLPVDFRKPLVAAPMATPPVLDGRLEEAWGEPSMTFKNTGVPVYLRCDAQSLYLAVKLKTIVDEKGKHKPWRCETSGADAPVWNDDSIEIFFADRGGGRVAHFGASISGARFEALAAPGAAAENPGWNAPWTCAVGKTTDVGVIEMTIPLAALKAAGLDPAALDANLMVNQRVDTADRRLTQGEALCFLGGQGRRRCAFFMPLGLGKAPAPYPPRRFTVRLHFAEPEKDAGPGRRVFDVKLQGRTILKDFDVVKEAGAPLTAIIKEFKGVQAAESLVLELVPAAKDINASNAPVLCAFEIREETAASASRAELAGDTAAGDADEIPDDQADN